ncbi:bifunctional diaminohydroxyphosphoribosylaminopyrimidine deaminase/5-amino-6-(5-phosphoribosylamino)uracil reductase RibD [Olivibacter sp. SDN3]|uniref:bifunctional diaminohydroxyphosphoribosylaminopyrimidine deaminase/5-amino-6-(5-phosphoribosylamino)uracil reductase RibD n=1 Tax=Olivibacter sp. SDN3 TaxID=2764720 RepID=UPI0016519855|nr:bifunctional diaminohydroxyphosphoribosylaminopyrimidine deaminase/5-amino-6-(5-phosphoribosylamino)uracil reductase RibD [Olivibacter sp. SDN3]QNL48606.1 bifunctional diaminohydroxyphosphoribosylaminopyrimidine deaminase/5-amino-6-(5-phosphoribosylamino)uracil reductase RibD [Olivibacter sp. SDN3]
MPNHERYMQRCIQLAQLGQGFVSPNPIVGALLVHQDKIIGEGWHRQYGKAHAEPNAINEVFEKYDHAAELLKESTLYVTLEPCAHQGKTPPCADLIIKHGIPRVVVACRDPFDAVNGKGIDKLRSAGINVIEGVLKREASFINRRFFTRVSQSRPYVILKWAQTANGYFAPIDGTQQWISGSTAKILSHKWRSEEDAVLVGANTARIDNPQLNVRHWEGKNPKRVVIDKDLSLADNLHLFDGSVETLVFNAVRTEWQENIKYITLENFDWYLPQYILYQLHLMDIQSLIIEGGVKTLHLFITAGLWDEARVFRGPNYWENGIKAPELDRIPKDIQLIDKDILTTYFNN